MAAAARPLPQPDDSASPGVTRLGRSRASRTAIDYKRLHRGTLARERIPSQSTDKSSDVQESRLETILKAIAGVHDSVDERFALVQEAIDQVPDVSQVKEAVADEVKDVVQEQLKATVQREIVHAIGEEVKRTVQQQVSEVVRREIRSAMQHEVMNIVGERVAAIVRQQVTSIVKEQVTAIVQQQVTSIVREQVTSIVQEQVTAIVEKQLSSVQHSSPNPSYADVARTPPGSRPSNLRTISNRTTPSTFTDTLYCTVDVTNVEEAERDNASASKIRQNIEKEMREGEEGSGWRCVAVTRDPRHAARIRVTCRDESELARVKEVVEKKVDNMSPQAEGNTSHPTNTPLDARVEQSRIYAPGRSAYSSLNVQRDLLHELQRSSACLAVPHKVLLWPQIYSDVLESQTSVTSDMHSILDEGMSWFTRREHSKHPSSLSAGNGLPAVAVDASERTSGHTPNIIFPTLVAEQLSKSTADYFDIVNLLYPILDRGQYMEEIHEPISREGHKDGDARSVIMLLVVALGQVSTEGISGAPISIAAGQASGFRGGSAECPPGLAAFNEARRRFGFIAMDCTLENAQVLLLQSIYYESHARHIEYWRCITSASLALQGLLKVQQVDWTSFYGDQVKRAFWACVVQENLFHIDLDLPGTGLGKFEDVVPLPQFHEWQRGDHGAAPPESWIFHGQSLAMIAIRAIITRINDVIYASEGTLFVFPFASVSLTKEKSIRLTSRPTQRHSCTSGLRCPGIGTTTQRLENGPATAAAMAIKQ